MATAHIASLPSSTPLLARQNAMDITPGDYPVMNLSNIFSQNLPHSPPTLTQLEGLVIEPLDISDISSVPLPLHTAIEKLNELKGLMREFNYKIFAMPLNVNNQLVSDATNTINTILDSPIQSEITIHRPQQNIWVPLFERFISTMEQLPNGPEMRDLALDIEAAFTNILGEIEDSNITYMEYTVTMFGRI